VGALAIETSGRVGSVALIQDGGVIAEETFAHGLQNAAQILPIIDRLCRARGWTAADLREIYVSTGPGSFTGLRIGITLAKTLAMANGARVVAVPSTRALALNAPADAQNLIIVLDAKRGQIYTASFRRTAEGWESVEPAHLDTLANIAERTPRPVHLLGEGIPYHRAWLTGDASVYVTGEELWRARASAVAEVGMAMAAAGQFSEADALTPIYIRPPEAEEKFVP
jgi:tRNA threonylcarbamoyladenosine biosynthesis protein TsaB